MGLAYMAVGVVIIVGLASLKPLGGSYDRFLFIISAAVVPAHLLIISPWVALWSLAAFCCGAWRTR